MSTVKSEDFENVLPSLKTIQDLLSDPVNKGLNNLKGNQSNEDLNLFRVL